MEKVKRRDGKPKVSPDCPCLFISNDRYEKINERKCVLRRYVKETLSLVKEIEKFE